jgi:hypothetical protein
VPLSEYSNINSAQYTTKDPEIKETNKTQHSPTSRLGMKKKKTVPFGSSTTKGYYLCIKLRMVG